MPIDGDVPLKVTPSNKSLGAEVGNLDVDCATDNQIADIREALFRHLVVRIRGQSQLGATAYVKFASRFGDLEVMPAYAPVNYTAERLPPEISVVSNVVENGKAVGDHGNSELKWHTDYAFSECPSHYTFLLGREVLPSGGNTCFTDMFRAYEKVPASLKPRLASLKLKHQCSHNGTEGKWDRRRGYEDIDTTDPRELPGPLHPIVRTHPETGRKALYLGRRLGAYIPGLTLARSEALLDELWSYAGSADDVWIQQWRLGDILIWDNRWTMHRRDSLDGTGRRTMLHISTRGFRPT